MSVLIAERSFTNDQIRAATSPADLAVTAVQFNALKLVVPPQAPLPEQVQEAENEPQSQPLYDDLRTQTAHNDRKQSRVDDHKRKNSSILDRQLQLARSDGGGGRKPPRNTLADVPGFRGTLSSTSAVNDTQQDEVFDRRFQLSDMQTFTPEF